MENEKARENAKEEKISQVLSAVAEAMVKEALSDVPDSSMTVVSGNKDSTIVDICVNGNNGIFGLAADSSKWIDKLPAVVKVLCDSEKSGEEIYDALLKGDLPIAEVPESQSVMFSLTASKTGFLRLFCKGTLWQITPKNVKSVELFGVSLISDYAFSECSSLKAVEIPSSVTEIGKSAFSECHSLEAVKIPSSVTVIDSYAFNGCSSLKAVEIPSSVTEIGSGAFASCISLSDVQFVGTVAQWEAVQKGGDWCKDVSAKSVKCTDGEVSL